MGKLNRAAIITVAFSLSISLLFSSCKVTPDEATVSSEESLETESSSTSSSDTEQTDSISDSTDSQNIDYPFDLSVQIIGSVNSGDCTIIRYNDIEILIDTALGEASIKAVETVLEEKKKNNEQKDDDTKDKTWDYVIFTHPDNDHIGKANKLFDTFRDEEWKVGHVIDFGVEREEDQESPDEKAILRTYKEKLKELKDVDYYSPNGDLSPSHLTKEYVIDSRFKITILYNEAYVSGDDNNQSVCCLFQLDEQKLLFTGDLEQAGENGLLKYHRELLRNVTFFKAGHHGSDTSNTQEFVDWIRPAYVAITYNHEITEDALADNISRFIKYTDYIYPTVVKNDIDRANTLFGDCSFEFNGKSVNVSSNLNNNCTIRQAVIEGTTTNWYWKLVSESKISDEINTYFLDENVVIYDDGGQEVINAPGSYTYYNCTLVKYGHYDILIDCGSNHVSDVLVEKLKDYVVDGIIEYVVVSHYHLPNFNQLIGSTTDTQSVFVEFKIENIIDNDVAMTNCYNSVGSSYSAYLSKVLIVPNRISIHSDDCSELSICDGVKLCVYRGNKGKQQDNEDDYSLVTTIDFNGNQMVFVGDLTNYKWFNDTYAKKLKNVQLMRFPSSYVDFNKMKGFDEFLKITQPEVVVIGSPVNHWYNGQYFIKGSSISNLITFLENSSRNRNIRIFSPGYIENNTNKSVFGDIAFTCFKSPIIINNTTYNYYVSCHIYEGNEKAIDGAVTERLNTSYYRFVPDDLRKFPAIK